VTEETGSAAVETSTGDQVAGYRIEAEIGRGGMATVFRALDAKLGRTVALKILAPRLADDESFRRRFIHESRAAAAVDHPHIVPVFEAGDADGILFIAMRYVGTGDVRTLLEREGSLPVEQVVGITLQVASALDAAHARGLVHRDIKPANMLLAESGEGRADHVYLSDFGLSKHSLSPTGLTSTGQFMGTLDYVAPEQIEGKAVDGRADQYALACAAVEMLTGAPPFRRDENIALMWAQLSEAPPVLRERRPELPPAIDDVMARALAKAPAERYPTCMEFAEALRAASTAAPQPDRDQRRGDSQAGLRQPTELAQVRQRAAAPDPTSAAPVTPLRPAAPPGRFPGPSAPPPSFGHAGPGPASGFAGPPPIQGPPPGQGGHSWPAAQPAPGGQYGLSGPPAPAAPAPWPAQPPSAAPPAQGIMPGSGPAGSAPPGWSARPAPLPSPWQNSGAPGSVPQQSGPAPWSYPPAPAAPSRPGPGGSDIMGSADLYRSATIPAPTAPRQRTRGRGRTVLAVAAVLIVLAGLAGLSFKLLDRQSTAANVGNSTSTGPGGGQHGHGGSHPVVYPHSPAGVVQAYFRAINQHHYRLAWRLGGKSTPGTYQKFRDGFTGTEHDKVQILASSGPNVTARVTAVQSDGSQKVFQGIYTVIHGVIAQSQVVRVG
jgi:serine/threonine protein kinase